MPSRPQRRPAALWPSAVRWRRRAARTPADPGSDARTFGSRPYELEGDVLRVAIADPGNLHAIDELRLAMKHSIELVVASRADIRAELQHLVRTAEAIGSIVAVDLEQASDDSDDLEADDGISDGPSILAEEAA